MRKVSYGWITRACQLEVERRILLCETSLPRRTYHAIPFSPTMRCSLCRWAYGIVLIEVLQDGNSPYAQLLNSEVLAKVPRGYRCPQPLGCPDEVYALLIEKCWNVDPHLRADFTTVVELLENIEYTMVNRKMWTMPGSGEEYQVLAEIEEEIVHEPPSREYSISGDMKDDRNAQRAAVRLLVRKAKWFRKYQNPTMRLCETRCATFQSHTTFRCLKCERQNLFIQQVVISSLHAFTATQSRSMSRCLKCKRLKLCILLAVISAVHKGRKASSNQPKHFTVAFRKRRMQAYLVNRSYSTGRLNDSTVLEVVWSV